MASLFNTQIIANPSRIEPQNIVTIAQASGFMSDLGEKGLRTILGPVDKYVYMNHVDLRTQTQTNQASQNLYPSATIRGDYVSTATYNIGARAEYDELDIAEAAVYNVALPAAHRLAMRQAIFIQLRLANLYGINPANSEGLLNTPNATAVTLPPDSYGNDTIPTYDAGQLALFFLGQIAQAKIRMFQSGIPTRIVILGPQRVLTQMQYQNIVQLTSYQRPGAGSATTAQVMEFVGKENGDAIEYAYDDTLIGKGSGGSDAVLIVIPEIKTPSMPSLNTNEFASKLPNGSTAMTFQYSDVAAPVEYPTPIPGGGIDVVSRMRISSGWAPRGQAVSILSLPY